MGSWLLASSLALIQLTTTPAQRNVGVTAAKQSIELGGFSGLYCLPGSKASYQEQLICYAVTDRGPNLEPMLFPHQTKKHRPFPLPDFQPRIVKLNISLRQKQATIDLFIPLKNCNNHPLSGLPNLIDLDETPVTLTGKQIAHDPWGMDTEAIVVDEQGEFWIAEEYGPSLAHFNANGTLIKRYVPESASPQARRAGEPVLSPILASRKPNRGFEGLGKIGEKFYLFMQSPLSTEGNISSVIRIIEFDRKKERETGVYVYHLDDPNKADKIGDATYAGVGKQFYVIEQNGQSGNNQVRKIFRIDLAKATNILAVLPQVRSHATLEMMDQKAMASQGVVAVAKQLYRDLHHDFASEPQLNHIEKWEGLFYLPHGDLLLVNDNDFGIGQSQLDFKAGKWIMPTILDQQQTQLLWLRVP